jgi:hypothetical protein
MGVLFSFSAVNGHPDTVAGDFCCALGIPHRRRVWGQHLPLVPHKMRLWVCYFPFHPSHASYDRE